MNGQLDPQPEQALWDIPGDDRLSSKLMFSGTVGPVIKIPRVFSSGALAAKVGDIDVHLLTVESWGERIVVRLVAASTDAIRAELAGQEAKLDQWAKRRQAGSDEWPPQSPGERIAESLRVRIDDGAGTRYRLSVKTAGGSGTELLSEWIFKPALPPDTSTVTVTVTSKDGSKTAHVATFADRDL